MLKKLIFIMLVSSLLSSCVITHKKYSKGGSPMEIKAGCIESTIIGNTENKVKKNKSGNIIFTYQGFKLNVVYSETNLVVSSAGFSKLNELTETVDLVWRNLANSCKKESAYPIIYQ